jgi:hypothetical protein
MARLPTCCLLIVLASCCGCTSSTKYADPTVNRAMNYETPATGEPTIMHGTNALSTYGK